MLTIAMAFNLVKSPALKQETRQTKKNFFSLKEDAFSVYDPCSYDGYLRSSEEDLKNSGLKRTTTLTSQMPVHWSSC